MNVLEIDPLQLYMGDDYVINDKIKIHQVTIGELVAYGEREYFSTVQTLSAIPSDLKSQLWDSGVDWTQITDFQLAMMLWPSLPLSKTKILFGDMNLQNFVPRKNLKTDSIVLRDDENDITIDELIYMRICAYLCASHNITKKVEKAANEFTKKFLIDEDRQKIEYQSKQPYKSFLLPLISAVKVRQGYTKDYVKNMGLCEFMDEISRLQIIVNADALLQGSYSGMVDTSKIPKSHFDWLRPIDNNSNNKGAMALN